MAEIIKEFASLGAIGVIAYALFKNTLEEKKEDRELFRKSVETFEKSIGYLTIRVENVEDGISRTENKVDKILENVGE